jgi:hypothetical protein
MRGVKAFDMLTLPRIPLPAEWCGPLCEDVSLSLCIGQAARHEGGAAGPLINRWEIREAAPF